MNTLCGQTQAFFGNKFGIKEAPPSHHLSAKVGPVVEADCGHVLKQYTVAATQNRSGLFSFCGDWGAGNTLRVVHITESQNH